MPPGLPYKTLLGVWHQRKLIRTRQIASWLEVLAPFIPTKS